MMKSKPVAGTFKGIEKASKSAGTTTTSVFSAKGGQRGSNKALPTGKSILD